MLMENKGQFRIGDLVSSTASNIDYGIVIIEGNHSCKVWWGDNCITWANIEWLEHTKCK